jgi:uncharacterized cupredoxin-like copper-binding protein
MIAELCGSTWAEEVNRLKKIALVTSAVIALAAVPAVSSARPAVVDGTFNMSAHDYGFNGIKDRSTVDAGKYKFKFENRSKQRFHEMILVRNKSKMSPREILRLAETDEDKAISKVEFKGNTFAKPEKTGEAFTTELTEGKYFYMCFVTNSKKSPAHWKLGMLRRFTVE